MFNCFKVALVFVALTFVVGCECLSDRRKDSCIEQVKQMQQPQWLTMCSTYTGQLQVDEVYGNFVRRKMQSELR